MFKSAALLTISALSALAIPSSPGACQRYASLSFKFPPVTAPEVTAHVIYNNLTSPRDIHFDDSGNLLVIERPLGVTALTPRFDATCPGWERRIVLTQADLNHGIQVGPGPKRGRDRNQYLYASSQESVFRWEYDPRNAVVVGNRVTITYNMTNLNPIPPDHVTRSMLLQPPNDPKYVIVTRGATADPKSGPAEIRRFKLDGVPPSGWSWQQGEILGWGLRNGVGIAFSKDGKSVWEVENGPDNAHWQGVDVHNNNPAEELNKIPLVGTFSTTSGPFYGYPYCFATWSSAGIASTPAFNFQPGQHFSVEDLQVQHTDAWCNNPNNVVKPSLLLEPHSAPLGLVFYDTASCTYGPSSLGLPRKWDGDAFISLHGSWNRVPSIGYKVIRVPFKNSNPVAPYGSTNGFVPIVSAPDPTNCDGTCIRPVSLAWDKQGRLYVSSDETGEIFVVEGKSAP
ncbi:hypothetical protein FRC10_006405 [Ceratobasidium sp. 414]|nr:hypothetical protein FRC10_006405 [Ceratobasidium sp. 414]